MKIDNFWGASLRMDEIENTNDSITPMVKPYLNPEIYTLALNNLPFGVSIQTKDRTILYENKFAASLFGNTLPHDKCFHRWIYLPGGGNNICKDCPATISLEDKKTHQVFRKTLNRHFEEMYVEVQCIPILNNSGEIIHYLEIIKDVTDQEKAKTLIQYSLDDIIDNFEFSLIKYGLAGPEVLYTDRLSFLTANFDISVFKLASFTYIGLLQNNSTHTGLYGPLPVLDYLEYSMLAFVFNLASKDIIDPRRKGKDNCMLLIFYKRAHNFLFTDRDKILKFVQSKVAKISFLEDINSTWFERFKLAFKKYITEIN